MMRYVSAKSKHWHTRWGGPKKNVKGGRKKGIVASLIENGTKLKHKGGNYCPGGALKISVRVSKMDEPEIIANQQHNSLISIN